MKKLAASLGLAGIILLVNHITFAQDAPSDNQTNSDAQAAPVDQQPSPDQAGNTDAANPPADVQTNTDTTTTPASTTGG